MKYQPPVNSQPTEADPEPAYFNGNPQAGQKGAIPPAKAIEDPMREILAVITAAGLIPSETDMTQLLQAINLIAAGVGGTPASFALNPVYPEVITGGGVCSISSSSGQVALNTAQQWIHRGGNLFNSSDILLASRTFNTVASKTYHLRWRYNGGSPVLGLFDLADGGYNPSAKLDADIAFDTTYDDMLIARVVTNGANTPTVTALKNLSRLMATYQKDTLQFQSGSWEGLPRLNATLNWARTPRPSVRSAQGELSVGIDALTYVYANATRYALEAAAFGYGSIEAAGRYQSGAITVDLAA